MLYDFLGDNARFADLYNGVCFGGREIIRPEDLSELDGRYVLFGQGNDSCKEEPAGNSRNRDLKKLYRGQALLRLMAVENQMVVDYTMPWRCMNYDVREYEKQIRDLQKKNRELKNLESGAEYLCGLKKEDRLIPVYTLCVYYGEKQWDGPLSLKDMMNLGEGESEWERLFKDYPFHLIDVNERKKDYVFRTSLREVFGVLPYRSNKEKMRRQLLQNPAYRSLDYETYRALALLIGEKRLLVPEKNEKEEEWDMCKALEDMLQEDREEGRREGELAKLIQQVCRKLAKGKQVEEIAEELEEELDLIKSICIAMEKCGADATVENIYQHWLKGGSYHE